MHRLVLVVLLGSSVVAVMPRTCLACPMCAEAVPNSSSAEDEDQTALARAYNRSIYLMVGVPYLLVGAVGYRVYRHLRVRDAQQALLLSPPAQLLSPGEPTLSSLPGDRSCSLSSLDGAS